MLQKIAMDGTVPCDVQLSTSSHCSSSQTADIAINYQQPPVYSDDVCSIFPLSRPLYMLPGGARLFAYS